MVRWQASILSLGSGDGIPVLVDQNEVCQKWQNLDNTIQLVKCVCKVNLKQSRKI